MWASPAYTEFQALLDNCSDRHFRDVLIGMRYTPARPGDIRNLTWAMVNWDQHIWLITKHKTTKTAKTPKPFVIGMNEEVERVLEERKGLAEEAGTYAPEQRVFTNRNGRPWVRDSLGLRMRRLRAKAKILADANGEEFVLYTNRHTFITTAGMDASIPDAVRVNMAGHTDTRTTQIYTHLPSIAAAEAGRRVADKLRPQAAPSPGK